MFLVLLWEETSQHWGPAPQRSSGLTLGIWNKLDCGKKFSVSVLHKPWKFYGYCYLPISSNIYSQLSWMKFSLWSTVLLIGKWLLDYRHLPKTELLSLEMGQLVLQKKEEHWKLHLYVFQNVAKMVQVFSKLCITFLKQKRGKQNLNIEYKKSHMIPYSIL